MRLGAPFRLNPREERLVAPLHPRRRPWAVSRAPALFVDLARRRLERALGRLGLAWRHSGSYLTLVDPMSYAMASLL